MAQLKLHSFLQGIVSILKIHSHTYSPNFCCYKLAKFHNFLLPVQTYICILRVSVQFSHLVLSNSLRPHGLQHTRPPCPSSAPGARSNSCPSAIQPSHPLSSPSPPALSLSQDQGLFQWVSSSPSGGQSTGASASALVFPMNIQSWFPLGLTGWISLQSKGLSRVFSKHALLTWKLYNKEVPCILEPIFT